MGLFNDYRWTPPRMMACERFSGFECWMRFGDDYSHADEQARAWVEGSA